MRDYIKRFLIAGIVALCVSLLFLGGKHSQAQTLKIEDTTEHWVWPADGVVTDTFGTRNGSHKGMDIAAAYGTPIYAVDEGTVSKSYYSDTYGHVVFIKHKNETETVYAHLKKRIAEEGQKVKKGAVIGEMGSTGDSSGVHLHFEIHKREWTYEKENAINPFIALGEAKIGQIVQALVQRSEIDEVMEASARPRIPEDEVVTYHNEKGNNTKKTDIVHIVETGDTLWKIADQYNVKITDIKKTNKLKGNNIVTGQKLMVYAVKSKEYIVKPGDTLYSISKHLNTSVEEIKKQNNLNSNVIKTDQVLKIH